MNKNPNWTPQNCAESPKYEDSDTESDSQNTKIDKNRK